MRPRDPTEEYGDVSPVPIIGLYDDDALTLDESNGINGCTASHVAG